MKLVFLGTGGGRFVMTFQKRRTGGFLVKVGKLQMHVDPGPGALVNIWRAKENPTKTRLIFVSHMHTDHYTESPAMVEAMTEETRVHRGMLIGSKAFLEGVDGEVQGISEFHKSLTDCKVGIPGDVINLSRLANVNGLTMRITKAFHEEKTAVGFVLDDGRVKLGYTSDSGVNEEMKEQFSGVDVIVMNTISPWMNVHSGFMTLGGAIELVGSVRPKLTIIQHFGIRALRYGPERMAKELAEKTGVRCIAAKDFMKLDLDAEIKEKSLMSW